MKHINHWSNYLVWKLTLTSLVKSTLFGVESVDRCLKTLQLYYILASAYFSPLSGENAILLLKGELCLSLSEGRYLFLLPLSPCCWRESGWFIVHVKKWKNKYINKIFSQTIMNPTPTSLHILYMWDFATTCRTRELACQIKTKEKVD